MTTTQRRPKRDKTTRDSTPTSILVDSQHGTEAASELVYATAAALGLEIVDPAETGDASVITNIEVSGSHLQTGAHRWQYPHQGAEFERWLVATCFPQTADSISWAVVQTSTQTYPLLAAAMAYSQANSGAVLIDADPASELTDSILEGTHHDIEVLEFNTETTSPHVYLLNAPTWAGITLVLQAPGTNPLTTVCVTDTVAAAQQHFGHVVINCGADLFLAQRLAADGTRVIHVDDAARPLKVNFQAYKKLDYTHDRIPDYGTRTGFELISTTRRRRKGMRRWMNRGDR